MSSVYVQQLDNVWYLRTPYGVFSFDNELEPRKLADIIKDCYEQGKRDKINEIREALCLEDAWYE